MNPPSPNLPKKRWPAAVRWTLGILVVLGLMVGGAMWWLWRDEEGARREWEAYRAQAAARGEKIELKDFLRGPIPEAENFAASPLFRGAGRNLPNPFQLPPRVGKRKARMNAAEELAAWHADFVSAGWIAKDDRTPTPAALWKALDRLAAPWKQLEEAAAKPDARFDVPWEKGTLEVSLNHVDGLMAAARVAKLRALVKLAEKKPAEALREWRMVWRLAQTLKREPTLICGLVKMSSEHLALEIFQDGLEASVWTKPELEEIERVLATSEAMKDFVWCYSSERASAADVMLHFKERYLHGSSDFFGQEVKYSGQFIDIYHSLVQLNRQTDYALSQFDVARHRFIDNGKFGEPKRSGVKVIDWRRYALYSLLAGDFSSFIRKSVLHVTRIDQARVIGALERHRLARGKYPEALEALVPEFLPSIPNDVFDGAPLRYKLVGEKAVVYSVGTNLKDDGGATSGMLDDALDWYWGMPTE